jgi:hypothetical protein
LEYQEVILRIGPLGKLGLFESTAEIFFVDIASISFASGPILRITFRFAKVLHGHGLGLTDAYVQVIFNYF